MYIELNLCSTLDVLINIHKYADELYLKQLYQNFTCSTGYTPDKFWCSSYCLIMKTFKVIKGVCFCQIMYLCINGCHGNVIYYISGNYNGPK